MTTRKRVRVKRDFSDRDHALIYEAFLTGRIYAHGGEKESPAEIHEKTLANCRVAVKRFEKPKKRRVRG